MYAEAAGAIIGGIAGLFGPKQSIPRFDDDKAVDLLKDYRNQISSLFSSTPQVSFDPISVSYNEVDPIEAASSSLGFNLENFDSFSDMASRSNDQAVSDKLNMLESFMPNWDKERDIASNANISMMKGEIPADVRAQISRNSALRNLQSGQSYNPKSARKMTARDLGITSLDLIQQGQNQSKSWMQTLASLMPEQTSAFDMMQFSGLSTKDALTAALENARGQLQADTTTAVENSRGKFQADMANADYSFRGASAIADSLQNYTQGRLAVIDKNYASDMTASGIKHENDMMPWQGAASIGAGVSSMFGLGSGGGFGFGG